MDVKVEITVQGDTNGTSELVFTELTKELKTLCQEMGWELMFDSYDDFCFLMFIDQPESEAAIDAADQETSAAEIIAY